MDVAFRGTVSSRYDRPRRNNVDIRWFRSATCRTEITRNSGRSDALRATVFVSRFLEEFKKVNNQDYQHVSAADLVVSVSEAVWLSEEQTGNSSEFGLRLRIPTRCDEVIRLRIPDGKATDRRDICTSRSTSYLPVRIGRRSATRPSRGPSTNSSMRQLDLRPALCERRY